MIYIDVLKFKNEIKDCVNNYIVGILISKAYLIGQFYSNLAATWTDEQIFISACFKRMTIISIKNKLTDKTDIHRSVNMDRLYIQYQRNLIFFEI